MCWGFFWGFIIGAVAGVVVMGLVTDACENKKYIELNHYEENEEVEE